jgi:hypothetical protein
MRSMARHSFGSAVLIAMATGAFVLLSSRGHETQLLSCLVSTMSGDVQGADLGASCAFRGIPFAAPPIGSLRWKPPQPAAPWAPTTLMTTAPPPVCPQVSPAGSTMTQGFENCLTPNIWTPDPHPRRRFRACVDPHRRVRRGNIESGSPQRPEHR